MSNRGIRKKALRVVAGIAVGGSVFQIGGCDPAVRATLLAGLATTTEALTDTLITAFFTGLVNDAASAGSAGSGTGLTTT